MTDQEKIDAAIQSLRKLGCAVVVWTADEIGDADPDQLEAIMTERGAIYLDSFA